MAFPALSSRCLSRSSQQPCSPSPAGHEGTGRETALDHGPEAHIQKPNLTLGCLVISDDRTVLWRCHCLHSDSRAVPPSLRGTHLPTPPTLRDPESVTKKCASLEMRLVGSSPPSWLSLVWAGLGHHSVRALVVSLCPQAPSPPLLPAATPPRALGDSPAGGPLLCLVCDLIKGSGRTLGQLQAAGWSQ